MIGGAVKNVLSFFFNDTATTEIYTLSLHDALPISVCESEQVRVESTADMLTAIQDASWIDRKSTRLNSSHLVISYAVFCLKKKTRRHIRAAHQPRRAQARRAR